MRRHGNCIGCVRPYPLDPKAPTQDVWPRLWSEGIQARRNLERSGDCRVSGDNRRAVLGESSLAPVHRLARKCGDPVCLCLLGSFAVWSIARPTLKAWVEVSSVTAFLFLLLPVLNAATSSRGTLTNVTRDDPLYIGFDLVSLARSWVGVSHDRVLDRTAHVLSRSQVMPHILA